MTYFTDSIYRLLYFRVLTSPPNHDVRETLMSMADVPTTLPSSQHQVTKRFFGNNMMKLALALSFLVAGEAFVPSSSTTRRSFVSTSSSSSTSSRLSSTFAPTNANGGWGGMGESTNGAYGYGGGVTTMPQSEAVATVPKVAQRWRKSTKQVVTLGPASSSKE